MEWAEVVAHPALRDLPFKIELNEYGKIVMTPAKVIHAMYRGELGHLLHKQRLDGLCATNCAIRTRQGTKVADVVHRLFRRYWSSRKLFLPNHIRYTYDYLLLYR